MPHARGPFEVKIVPQPPTDADEPTVGRLSLVKSFSGDLVATSKGTMLAVRTAVADSAGYVALERVTGTLAGRRGSFALQHSGTMNRGTPGLVITVVPDSGTEELTGISGRLAIDIAPGGAHSYDLEYELPAT